MLDERRGRTLGGDGHRTLGVGTIGALLAFVGWALEYRREQLLNLRRRLRSPRLERFIGVIYRPDTELLEEALLVAPPALAGSTRRIATRV